MATNRTKATKPHFKNHRSGPRSRPGTHSEKRDGSMADFQLMMMLSFKYQAPNTNTMDMGMVGGVL